MKVAYLSPFWNDTNRLTEIQKELLASNGYEVRPFSMRTLASPAALGLFRAGSVVLVNWLEMRPFVRRKGRMTLSVSGLVQFAIYWTVLAFARARVVYFIHDNAVHDTEGRLRRFSSRLIASLARLADVRAVHDPSACARLNARYLPHPLYWEFRPAQTGAGTSPGAHAGAPVTASFAALREKTGQPTFKALGAIKAYKALHEVLEVWPQTAKLHIRGRGDPQYLERLDSVVRQRGLASAVVIRAGLMSEEEFDYEIATTDVLLLPHMAGSMLVSGAFFEAVGRARAIIARRTPFMAWAAGRLPGIYLFDQVEELPSLIDTVLADWPQLASAEAVREEARSLFGREQCVLQYGAVLG